LDDDPFNKWSSTLNFSDSELKNQGILLTTEFPYCSLTSLSAFFGDYTDISANAKRSHSPFKLAFSLAHNLHLSEIESIAYLLSAKLQ